MMHCLVSLSSTIPLAVGSPKLPNHSCSVLAAILPRAGLTYHKICIDFNLSVCMVISSLFRSSQMIMYIQISFVYFLMRPIRSQYRFPRLSPPALRVPFLYDTLRSSGPVVPIGVKPQQKARGQRKSHPQDPGREPALILARTPLIPSLAGGILIRR